VVKDAHGPREQSSPRRRFRRAAPVFFALGIAGALFAACGGSGPGVAVIGSSTTTTAPAGSSSSGQSGPTELQLLKYAVCMRTHGYPTMPDPVRAQGGGWAFKGAGTPGGIDLNSPQYQSAAKACEKDVPPSLQNVTPAESAAALKYTECMRSHGERNFPEPNSQGLISINPTGILDPNSLQFKKAETACEKVNSGLFSEVYTRRLSG
jgi:hypothetical protein